MTNPNWNWRPLGELFDIGAGKTMSAAARAGADKVPFLRTSNVLWDEIDLTQVDEMSISPTELVDKSLKAGDLLVCEGGEIGRAAVWDGRVPVMSFQNHLHRLRPIQDDVDARFYVYFLQSAFTQLGIFEGAGNKTTIPNLSRNRLAALDVPHPPKPEQQSVAQALAKVREAITVHDKATSTALELKHAVMNDLFTRGLRSEPQKETEIGLVPESWETAPIGSLFSIVQGVSLKGNLSADANGVPFLRTSNVYWRRIDLDTVSRMHVDPTQIADRMLVTGDLLVCEGGEIGRSAVWEGEDGVYTYQNHLHRLRPVDRDRVESRFAMAWLEVGFCLRNVYEGAGNKTTIPNLSRARLADLRMPVPSINEQREVVAILDAIDRKIHLHRKKRAVLEELFKALLHKLMTGEIAVSGLDLSALFPASTQPEEATA